MTTVATDPLRVVLIGTGRFGMLHARVWREAGATLVGLCDLDGARLAAAAAELGVSETDVEPGALVDRVRPDAVVIATDEASHVALALDALARGCHVFVEKPLALSAADAWRVRDAAVAHGREVVAGQISRFAAPYARMRATLDAGRIGQLCAMRLRRDFSRAWFLSFGDRVHPVWESCIHDIDLAISFARRPVTRVSAVASAAAGVASPSVVSAHLEFDDGVIATVESAWLVPTTAPQTLAGALMLDGSILGEAELLGLEGILKQRLAGDGLVEWTSAGSFAPDLSLWPDEGSVGGALRQEVDYAIGVFSGLRPPDRVPLEEVCWGVAAAEAVVRALDTGAPVHLEPELGAPR